MYKRIEKAAIGERRVWAPLWWYAFKLFSPLDLLSLRLIQSLTFQSWQVLLPETKSLYLFRLGGPRGAYNRRENFITSMSDLELEISTSQLDL